MPAQICCKPGKCLTRGEAQTTCRSNYFHREIIRRTRRCNQIIRTLSDNWEKDIARSNYCTIYTCNKIKSFSNGDYATGYRPVFSSTGQRHVNYAFLASPIVLPGMFRVLSTGWPIAKILYVPIREPDTVREYFYINSEISIGRKKVSHRVGSARVVRLATTRSRIIFSRTGHSI